METIRAGPGNDFDLRPSAAIFSRRVYVDDLKFLYRVQRRKGAFKPPANHVIVSGSINCEVVVLIPGSSANAGVRPGSLDSRSQCQQGKQTSAIQGYSQNLPGLNHRSHRRGFRLYYRQTGLNVNAGGDFPQLKLYVEADCLAYLEHEIGPLLLWRNPQVAQPRYSGPLEDREGRSSLLRL